MQAVSRFAFRGTRDYVHGTAILDWLLAGDPRPTGLDVQFRKTTDRQCELTLAEDASRQGELVATYVSDGMRGCLYETPTPVLDRTPCNEKDIALGTTLDESGAHYALPGSAGATPSQCIVALYKQSLQARFPDFDRKYFWARLVADYLPAAGTCTVQHQRRIGGDFFQGRVLHDGRGIGTIYFGAK